MWVRSTGARRQRWTSRRPRKTRPSLHCSSRWQLLRRWRTPTATATRAYEYPTCESPRAAMQCVCTCKRSTTESRTCITNTTARPLPGSDAPEIGSDRHAGDRRPHRTHRSGISDTDFRLCVGLLGLCVLQSEKTLGIVATALCFSGPAPLAQMDLISISVLLAFSWINLHPTAGDRRQSDEVSNLG